MNSGKHQFSYNNPSFLTRAYSLPLYMHSALLLELFETILNSNQPSDFTLATERSKGKVKRYNSKAFQINNHLELPAEDMKMSLKELTAKSCSWKEDLNKYQNILHSRFQGVCIRWKSQDYRDGQLENCYQFFQARYCMQSSSCSQRLWEEPEL